MRALRATLVAAALALVFYAVGCGDDDKNPVNPGGGGTADHVIQIVGVLNASSYSPSPDTVSVGETVAWHNADNMAHTATSDVTGATGFGTGTIAAGATSAPVAMNNLGSFGYHCAIHPTTMTGILVVK